MFPDGDEEAVPALIGLISIGVLAVSSNAVVFPLLPARYHLISRAPDRTGITLKAGEPDNLGEVVIGAEQGSDERPAFELFVCRNCGEPYIEAWESPIALEPTAGSGLRRLLRIVPGGVAAEEEDDTDVVDPSVLIHVDPLTGRPMQYDDASAVTLENVDLKEDPDDGTRYLARCVACNHRSTRFSEPVTTVRPGDEAIAAVAAQALLEAMPIKDKGSNPPMGGRNLLVFSDNRQDAAFFAPFFERTSREQAVRSAVLRAVKNGGRTDIDNLVGAVLRELRADGLRLYRPGVVPALETGANELSRLKALLVAELTVFGRGRLSLEGFGLIGVDYAEIERPIMAVKRVLPEQMQPHAKAFVCYLLKMIREHRSIAERKSSMIDLTDEIDLDAYSCSAEPLRHTRAQSEHQSSSQSSSCSRSTKSIHLLARKDGNRQWHSHRRQPNSRRAYRVLEGHRASALDDRQAGGRARSKVRPITFRCAWRSGHDLTMLGLREPNPVRYRGCLPVHGLRGNIAPDHSGSTTRSGAAEPLRCKISRASPDGDRKRAYGRYRWRCQD